MIGGVESEHTADARQPGSLTDLVALVAADILSRLGSVMTLTAIPWFVLVTTGSVARTGLTVFAEAVGIVIALLFGGVVVDRLPVQRASAGGDLVAGAAIVLVPVLYSTVGLSFWLLLALVFVSSLFDIPAQVARYSLLPDFAERANISFGRANAVYDALLTGSGLVGPALAGILIAWIGPSNILWIDAVSFCLSAAIVSTLLKSTTRTGGESTEQIAGFLTHLSAGVRFVLHDSVLAPLVVFLAITNLAIGPIESVIVPVLARDLYHSAYALGWLTSAIALGALGGNAVYGVIGHRLSRRGVFAAGSLSLPLVFAAMAWSPPLGVTIGALALLGLGLSLMNLLEYTIYFERLPAEMRARGLGLTGALTWASVPVGRVAAGLLLAALGIGAALGVFALVFFPVPLALLIARPFRVLEQRPATEPEG